MKKNDLIYKLRRSVFIRCMYFPFAKIIDKHRLKEYQKSIFAERVKAFKNKYIGKRCFVVGNGPSLLISDLEMIKNEYTFATNRIYQLFDKTEWRPSFYLSTDLDVINKGLDDINKLDLNNMFFNFNARKKIHTDPNKTSFIYLHGPFKINRHGSFQKNVSENLHQYFSITENVVCSCIEFAFYMGFKEIYLIGVDNSYGKSNNYAQGMHGGVKPDYNEESVKFTYNTLRKYAENHDISLINATRGGNLNYLKRVDLDSLF